MMEEQYIQVMHMRIPSIEERRNIRRISAIFSKQMLPAIDQREFSESFLKQAVKKQIDRRSKLRKLLETYTHIQEEEKKHARFLKCSMIELKDSPVIIKSLILADPQIFVANNLKQQSRQFLSTLLNTFYNTYEKNNKAVSNIKKTTEQLAFTIKELSSKEDKIFSIHTCHIQNIASEQLKNYHLTNQIKTLKNHHEIILREYIPLCEQHQRQSYLNKEQHRRINELEEYLQTLKKEKEETELKIERQEQIKKELWDKFLQQQMYEQKIEESVLKVENEIKRKSGNIGRNMKSLIKVRVNNAQMQNKKNKQNISNAFMGKKCDSNQNISQSLRKSSSLMPSFCKSTSTLTETDFGNIHVSQELRNKIKFSTSQEFMFKLSS